MSTTKRGVSLLLCLSMLVSMFSILGAIMPKARAAAGESQIKSYADCLSDYGAGFFYMGVDFYESDENEKPVLTDHYVEAGQDLEARVYIKTDRYVGELTIGLMWDKNFFDFTTGTTLDATMNPSYSAAAPANLSTNARALTVGYSWKLASAWSSAVTNAANQYLTVAQDPTLDQDITKSFIDNNLVATPFGSEYDVQNGNQVWAMSEDEYVFSLPAKVKTGLADGTTGFTMSAIAFYKVAYARSPWFVKFGAQGAACSAAAYAGVDPSYFHFEDCKHTFTIGENPDDQGGDDPGGNTEGTSVIKSYTDCKTDYGDGFFYMGVDFYEFDENEQKVLTDHYVEAGQDLEARVYIKTDRYVGELSIGLMWDKNFFDYSTGSTLDATMNPSYSAAAPADLSTNARALTVGYSWKLASAWSSAVTNAANQYLTVAQDPTLDQDITKAFIDNNLVATPFGSEYDVQNGNQVWAMSEDEYVFSLPAKVKTGLADGTTGFTMSAVAFYKVAYARSPWFVKFGAQGTACSAAAYAGVDPSYFHFEDCKHTFTIGSAGPVAKKYKANFYADKEKTDLISMLELEEGADVTPPADVAGQLGWADLATGEMVADFSEVKMGKKTLNYLRVMRDDAFDVVVNLDGGTLDPLPEGVTDNGDGTVTISAPMNSDVDLSALTPKKEGYTASFDPETVTMDNVNGKSVAVTWTPVTYHVSLFLEKGDAEPWTVLDIPYGSSLRGKVNASKPTREGFAFVKWLNVEDDSDVIPNNLTETKDLAYYATWNELDSSFAYMIYDYAAEDWKEAGKVYGNSGDTLTIATVNAFRNKLTAADFGLETKPDYAIGSNAYTVDGTGYSATSTSTTLTFGGEKEIFINTKLAPNVTFSVPVYDEATESYGDTTRQLTVPVLPDNNAAEKTVTVYKSDVKPADYYSLTGWIDQTTGEPVANLKEKDNSFEFTIDLREPHEIVAVFELTKYNVLVYINDSSNTGYLSEQSFALGDEVDLYALTFSLYPDGAASEEYKIPQVGHINTMDPTDGTLQVRGRDGYKMVKWIEFGSKNDIEPTFTMTKDVLYKGNLVDGTNLQVSAVWEANNYDADFYYLDANGEEVLYKTVSVQTGTALSNFRPDRGEDSDKVYEELNALAPAGKIFSGMWTAYSKTTGKKLDSTSMQPGGVKYVADYSEQGINVYQHFNNEDSFDEDGNPIVVRYGTPKYGEHLLAGYMDPDATYADMGIGAEIMNVRFPDSSTDKPAETQNIGWKVYHVLDEADLNNPEKWIEGINEITDKNDPDYDVVKYPTIFQAQWKPNRDFFFRIYGEVKVVVSLPIDGHEFSISIGGGELYCALGKDFKMYYWENDRITTKEFAVLESDETIVPIFFMIRLENFDIKRFFDGDMWKHVYVRIDQLRLPIIGTKSFYTFEGQKAFWEMIISVIKNLTGDDEPENPEEG